MDLIKVFQKWPTHESCIGHLETVRWGHRPACPLCGSVNVARKADGYRVGRWNCHACKSSFNVLSGTIFQKTRIDLQKWFLAIAIILNAKKSVSSYQLARDLDLTQPTAWYMAMRIRKAMVASDGELLAGIVEADEAYVGGRPRKGNKRDDDTPAKRGRGTDKLPIVGVVERGGRVVAEPSPKVNSASLTAFLSRNIDAGSLLITDAFNAYREMGRRVRHAVIDHSIQYVDGLIHTNTIEGFWSLLKRAWYGTHHHYSDDYALAYSVEACYKYNSRNAGDTFGSFVRGAVAAW